MLSVALSSVGSKVFVRKTVRELLFEGLDGNFVQLKPLFLHSLAGFFFLFTLQGMRTSWVLWARCSVRKVTRGLPWIDLDGSTR